MVQRFWTCTASTKSLCVYPAAVCLIASLSNGLPRNRHPPLLATRTSSARIYSFEAPALFAFLPRVVSFQSDTETGYNDETHPSRGATLSKGCNRCTLVEASRRFAGLPALPDGKSWQIVGQLKDPRFFHRMLPTSQGTLVVVGGASMQTGKVLELEVLKPVTVEAK